MTVIGLYHKRKKQARKNLTCLFPIRSTENVRKPEPTNHLLLYSLKVKFKSEIQSEILYFKVKFYV